MKTKTITISQEQETYILKNDLNLSRFVQRKLKERMKNATNTKD